MKVIDLSEAPLLASEVHSLMRENPRNALAFSVIDPLENSDITDSDELRRIVAVKRTVAYLENCLSVQSIDTSLLPTAIAALKSHGISHDSIVRLVDNAVLTGSHDHSTVYIKSILRDDLSKGLVQAEQVIMIRDILCILFGKAKNGSIADLAWNQPSPVPEDDTATPIAAPDIPPAKRRSNPSRKK